MGTRLSTSALPYTSCRLYAKLQNGLRSETASVWTFINAHRELYRNPLYAGAESGAGDSDLRV